MNQGNRSSHPPRAATFVFLAAATFFPCWSASAAVVTFESRSAFNAEGTISFNSNFSDFGSGFYAPGNPFTRGDVTYTSTDNLTVGSGTQYSIGDAQTVMANNWWTPITGTIALGPNYDLFGFDVAVTSGPIDITVFTNFGSYVFDDLMVANGSPVFSFKGFEATGAGEYFTGFRIDSQGGGYLAGITNVAVGIATVPEPTGIALFAFSAFAMGLRRRR